MSFLPGATVRFELGVWATTIGVPPVRVDEVIENVGLSEHVGSKVKSLSTGEKKRLSVPRAARVAWAGTASSTTPASLRRSG